MTSAVWAKDVNANADIIDVVLLCPVVEHPIPNILEISNRVRVVNSSIEINREIARPLVYAAALVQVAGGDNWKKSVMSRQVSRAAKKIGRPLLVGAPSLDEYSDTLIDINPSFSRARFSWIQRLGALLNLKWLVRQADYMFIKTGGSTKLVKEMLLKSGRN